MAGIKKLLSRVSNKKKKTSSPKSGGKLKRFLRILRNLIIFFLIVTILPVIIYKWVNPPITPLMLIRKTEGYSINKDWKSMKDLSPNLPLAAVSAEDDKFLTHHGFDFDALKLAFETNQKQDKMVKGGSTISQQTAKNVFLWPHRDYIRKGLETYFTFLIELFWSKERIMEVYLNIVEMGEGIYGSEAASQYYFKKPASKLNKQEAAAIIAILPNPRIFKVVNPSPRTQNYKGAIVRRMQKLGKINFK